MIKIRIIPLLNELKDGGYIQLDYFDLPDIEDNTHIIALDIDLLNNRLPNYIGRFRGFIAYISYRTSPLVIIKSVDYFWLKPFHNSTLSIDHLKVYNIKDYFHISNISIGRMDIEGSSSFIKNCNVKELYSDVEHASKNNEDTVSENSLKHFISIDYSNIIKYTNLYNKDMISISNSKFNKIFTAYSVDKFKIYNNCLFEYLLLNSRINDLSIEDSQLNIIKGTSTLVIDKLDIKYSFFDRIYEIYENNIICDNESKYQILINSYRNINNYDGYSKYSFLLRKILLSKHKGFIKLIPYYLLKISCGFGYKPIYSVIFSFSIITIFSIFYYLLTVFGQPEYGLNYNNQNINYTYLNSLYYSLVTFTTLGYGDILAKDIICKLLSGIEALFGIYSMSIIIYSFTKRNIEL
jgi:hypothetical protein